MNIFYIAVFLVTYFICSINPAIMICMKKTGQDIRNLGSGNAGTANALRVLGKPLGIVVIILDIFKVLLSYGICVVISKIFNQPIDNMMQSIFMVSAVIGHCFTIYYGFKGGKGVVVGITAAFILNKEIAIICIVVGLLIMAITRVVSIGSLAGLVTYIVLAVFQMSNFLIPIIISAIIVIFKHRSNIQRILSKQEHKI